MLSRLCRLLTSGCARQQYKSRDVRRLDLYVVEMRRHAQPFWREVASDADAEQCRHALVIGAQKRTLDMVAWYMCLQSKSLEVG